MRYEARNDQKPTMKAAMEPEVLSDFFLFPWIARIIEHRNATPSRIKTSLNAISHFEVVLHVTKLYKVINIANFHRAAWRDD